MSTIARSPQKPPERRPRKPTLTHRQQQALDYISACVSERGFPPTLREIGEHMGIRSTNGVNDHLKALERKGYIVREELKSRALRPVHHTPEPEPSRSPAAHDESPTIPILGRVAAGQPILAEENVVDRVVVDPLLLGNTRGREVFGLMVHGESMIDDGIHDGDYIFVRKQSTAERGEIVVVMIDGEATVKRIYPEGERVRLQPANQTMAPIYLRHDEFRAIEVLGKVIGVYRRVS